MLRVVLCLGIALTYGLAVAFDHVCDPPPEVKPEYPYPEYGAIRTKFVFVSFPSVCDTLTYQEHGVFADQMSDYFDNHSQGKLIVHEESDILLPPGAILDHNTTAFAWRAQLPAVEYRAAIPANWAYGDTIGHWTDGTSGNASPLYAEILYKIWRTYVDASVDSPFSEPEGDTGWSLQFVFLTTAGLPGPFSPGVGGMPDIYVDADSLLSDTEGFYQHVGRVTAGLAGNGQGGWAHGYLPPDVVYPQPILYYFLHEFAHTLGPGDGPPSLYNAGLDKREKYFYGNLNLLCQHFPPFHGGPFYGFPPIGDYWLADLPWNTPPGEESSVVDFTGKCLFRQKVYDVTTGGQLWRANVGDIESYAEYFLLAYHGGNGVEGFYNYHGGPAPYDPAPVVASQGLAVWHCAQAWGNHVVDLEAATGLFDYEGANIQYYEEPWYIPGLTPDTESGYDGYDGWLCRDDDDFGLHIGGEGDFFRIDHEDTNYYKPVFSYNTNPNCYGYSRDTHSHSIFRRRPQNVPNSLVVRIHEMGVDSERNDQQYMVVDLLFAPAERVTNESALDDVTVGIPINLEMTTFCADAITTFDVRYSNVGGVDGIWPMLVADNVAFDGNNPVFPWTPSEEQWSPNGRLRFEFTNTLTDTIGKIGYYESIGYYETPVFAFTGEGSVVVCEQIVSPNGGEILYEAQPSEIRWTNYFQVHHQSSIDSVAVHYDVDESGVWLPWTIFYASGSPSWDVDGETGDNVGVATPTMGMAHGRVRVQLTFYEGGNAASTVSWRTFQIYPTPFKFVNEDGEDHGVEYLGRPYATAVFDYDADSRPDVLVTMGEALGAEQSGFRLYRNARLFGQSSLRFQDRTQLTFQNSEQFGPGFRGLAVAAHDSLGNIEIFMAHPTAPAYLTRNPSTGQWYNVIGDQDAFDPDELELAAQSYCATWIDINRDGYLDLYVGRGSSAAFRLGDSVFLQQAQAGSPRFVESSAMFGLAAADSINTRTIAIADLEKTGRWDIVTGGASPQSIGPPALQYWRGREDGTFECLSVPGYDAGGLAPSWPIQQVELIDVSGNNDLNLSVIGHRRIVLLDTIDQLNPLTMALYGDQVTGKSADLDLDGRPDWVMVSLDSTSYALLNVIDRADFEQPLLSVCSSVGLDDDQPADALAAADFDGDGDIDLILGLTNQQDFTGRVKRSRLPLGSETPQNNWVGIRLNGQAEDNPWGIGATVELFDAADNPLGSQVISGGAGRGGQPDPVRIFGLGNHNGSVKAIVHWPLGFVDEFTVTAGVVNTLSQTIGCSLDEDSVDLTINYEPDGSIEWVFTWETDRWTKMSEERVTIEYVSGSNCGFTGSITLQTGQDPDVEVEPVRKMSEGVYLHELRWKDQACHLKCRYKYTVRSWNGVNPVAEVTSSEREIRFPVCPAMQ